MNFSVNLNIVGKKFEVLKDGLARWKWPETTDKSHLSKKTSEHKNHALYSPPNMWADSVSSIWESFTTNLDANRTKVATATTSNRFEIFRLISAKAETYEEPLPRMKLTPTKYQAPLSSLSHSEATWRELLLGGEDGPWRKALEHQVHTERAKKDKARAFPQARRY